MFEYLVFFLSSLISLSLIYYKVPIKTLQQIIVVLLLAILVFLNRYIFSKTKPAPKRWTRPVVLLLVATIVQLVVISTGGFLSPFLILIHLFVLGTSFLLNLRASVSFLVLSLIVLTANVWFNQNLFILFKDDPFSIALYFVSFIVIIPLFQLLNRNYYIKDVLSRILSENLHLGQQREQSLLRGLKELILVTDKDLKLLSVNEAVEKATNLSTDQILGSVFFDILPIKHKDGSKPTAQTLSVPQMLADKTTRIINEFYLSRPGLIPEAITIQARPIVDLKNEVQQLVFIIKEKRLENIYSGMHEDLDPARRRHQIVFEEIEKILSQSKANNVKFKAEILRKIEEDLLIAQELEDHAIKEEISFPDVAEISARALAQKKELAESLNVKTQLNLPAQATEEKALLNLETQNMEAVLREASEFGISIDPKWLQIILEKLLDIAILLASEQKMGLVQVVLAREDSINIVIEIIASYPPIPENLRKDLLTQYFGELGTKTNLRFGSGLEGFIAQTIANQLKLSLTIKTALNPSRLKFHLNLSREVLRKSQP